MTTENTPNEPLNTATLPPLETFLTDIEVTPNPPLNQQTSQKIQALLDQLEPNEPIPSKFKNPFTSPLIHLAKELPLSLGLLQHIQQQQHTQQQIVDELVQGQKDSQQAIQTLQQAIETQTQQQAHAMANDPSLVNQAQKKLAKLTQELQLEQQKARVLEEASVTAQKPLYCYEKITEKLRIRLQQTIEKNAQTYHQAFIHEQVIPLLQQAQAITTVTTAFYRDTKYGESILHLDYPLLSKALPSSFHELKNQPNYPTIKAHYQGELDRLLN